jgi:hypothetical protein
MSEQTTGRVRASDAEREQVVSVLRDAIGEGRLTMSEGEERIAAAYATTYRDELPGLTADLPQPEPARPRRGGPRPGPGRERRPGSPVPGVLMLAAVVTGVWALAAGGVLWPAIVLAVLALMAAKGGRRGHWQGGCGRHPAEADRRAAAGH